MILMFLFKSNLLLEEPRCSKQDKKAVLPQGNRDLPSAVAR